MAQEQNYEVNYTINVTATDGVKQLQEFAASVESLATFSSQLKTAGTDVGKMMTELGKIFPAKDGKRERSYTFVLKTRDSQARLNSIKKSLEEIQGIASGINVSINPGKVLNSRALKANAEKLIGEKSKAEGAVKDVTKTQETVTKAIGKVNAALIHFQTPRELDIKTNVAEQRLQSILSLLRSIRTEGRGLKLGVAGTTLGRTVVPMQAKADGRVFQLPPSYRIMPVQTSAKPVPATSSAPKQIIPEEAVVAVRNGFRGAQAQEIGMGKRQRAAINRLQYTRPGGIRNLMPFAYMLNGYMLYGMMRSELTKAVEYANIMESAHSILKVADKDLSTFGTRFDGMAQKVREVGIQTKFTAVEVAGAVKYLAMAGQDIESINKSIRPIANLALIGDNDISQIADLTTNIMAGYNVRPSSMDSVADIIASTVSRSNVNIIETAESFKMAGGFLQTSGVDFSEAAAAIGLLGNMGVKGTMAGTSLRAVAEHNQ